MKNSIMDMVSSYEPINLKKLNNSVRLMNRKDTKYIIPIAMLNEILAKLYDNYLALEIDSTRIFKYSNIYYDTPELCMYYNHHNGKLNRYKVRLRRYEDMGINYFEVKFKSNTNRTIKERIKVEDFNPTISNNSQNLLANYSFFQNHPLVQAVLNVDYSRITLVNKKLTDRITIDINLSYTKKNIHEELNKIAIIELKQDGHVNTPLQSILKSMHIYPVSMSKYCIGICKTNPQVKQNNFKSKIQKINRYHEIIF